MGASRAIYLANSRYFFALMSSTFSNNPELLCRWRFSFFSTDVKTMSHLLFLTLIILCKTWTIKDKLFQEETFFTIIFTYLHGVNHRLLYIWMKLLHLRTVFVKILKHLSLNAYLCIHFYWLSWLRQASHIKLIQNSALRLRLRRFKILTCPLL